MNSEESHVSLRFIPHPPMKHFIPVLVGCLLSGSAIAQNDSLVGKVYFYLDQHKLSHDAANYLRTLGNQLEQYSSIRLTGRADERGGLAYNDTLSARRIKSVANYLHAMGIPTDRITATTALGKRSPLATEESNLSKRRYLNRVVEIWGTTVRNSSEPSTTIQRASDPPAAPVTTAVNIQEQIKEGKSNIVLNNLNFEGGRHVLLPSSQPTLQAIVEVMKNNPGLEVEIRGHICCSAVNEDGLDIDTGERVLSRNRAREIYQYLINNGITANRLSYRGMGGSQKIIAEESSEEDRTTNRRVEFIIIKR
jgi:outer membrane protein OmpA-like peptidoglycan-associated protein